MFRLRSAVSAALIGLFVSASPAVLADDALPSTNFVQQFLGARKLCQSGRLHESELSYNDLLSSLKGLNASAALVARAYDELAVVLKIQGRFDEAEKNYLRAIQLLEQEDGHKGDRVGILLSHLGALYIELGQLTRADQYLSDSRNLLAASSSVPVFCRAALLQNLGVLATQRSHYQEAEQNYRDAITQLREGGADSRVQLAIVLGNLAQVLALVGRAKESFPLLVESESIFESMPAQFQSSHFTELLINADIQRSAGDLVAADRNCGRALNIGEELLGPVSPKMIAAYDVCSSVYKAEHHNKESKQLAARALAIRSQMAQHGSAGQTVDVAALMRENAR